MSRESSASKEKSFVSAKENLRHEHVGMIDQNGGYGGLARECESEAGAGALVCLQRSVFDVQNKK